MCMLRVLSRNKGMYTVEGAFTIVIFTVLIMMLLSIITIMETEVEIQSAINQTAMQLSQYSYAVGNEIDVENNETTLLKSIISDVKREALGFATGAALCTLLTENRINEKALYYVDGGFSGINFAASNILGDGRTITVIAMYRINVNTFGLFDKQLHICQKAQTAAWLPYYADELSAVAGEASSGGSSIWNETNFARGQFFVREEKEKQKELGVKAGQGIDLYDRESGRTVEIFSMNIFNPSYSFNSGNLKNAGDYSPNEEQMLKELNEHLSDYRKDIRQCGKRIVMDDDSEETFLVSHKEMILVLPNEARDLESFNSFFNDFKEYAKEKDDVDVKIIYSEDAL